MQMVSDSDIELTHLLATESVLQLS